MRTTPTDSLTAPGPGAESSPRTAGFPLATWLALTALLGAIALLWNLASPLSSGADEPGHALRAASLARGQLLGEPLPAEPDGPRLRVDVPAAAGELPEPACFAGHPEVPAGCDRRIVGSDPDGDGTYTADTTSGRHPPAYYLFAGLAYLLDAGTLSTYLARGLTGLLCAAFLAAALVVARRSPAPRILACGVLVAVTPMLWHLTGLVNANGPEAAAAVACWAALLAIARRSADEGPAPTWLLTVAGLGGLIMALTRPVSPLWLAIAVAAAAAVARPGVLPALVRDRRVWGWAAAGVLLGGAQLGWLLVVGNPILDSLAGVPAQPVPLSTALGIALGRTSGTVEELVGVFGWLDTGLPDSAWRAWLGVVALLCAGALAARHWRLTGVLVALLVLVVMVPATLEALQYNERGIIWQGRYTLPLAAGVPLLAAWAVAEGGPRLRALAEAAVAPLLALLVAVQGLAFWVALRRYTVGTSGPWNPLAEPVWQPPLAPIALLAALAALQVVVVLVVAGWRAQQRNGMRS